MTTLEKPRREETPVAPDTGTSRTATQGSEPSARTALLCLIGLVVVSTMLRSALTAVIHAPSVFSDELGYTKLAQSIGDARMGLFDNSGLSYSPLYSLLISPIYALGASPATAYGVIKIVNALLFSLAAFPTYMIARFVLSRRFALLVAGLALLAPLMSYTAFTISENAAYPACLLSLWAMLVALRSPSPRADAILLGSILLATAARVQLIVLFPVALTAVLLVAVLGRRPGERLHTSLAAAIKQHGLLFGVVVAAFLASALASASGHDVLSAFGRYSVVGRAGWPNTWHFLNVLMRHFAGLPLTVQIVPFVGTLVAASVFLRTRPRSRNIVVFAAVGVSALVWLLAEVAFDAALFDTPTGDVQRIHERFLIYLVPLFLVGLFAAFQVPEGKASVRVYLAAAGFTTLLALAIPFGSVVNFTVGFDSPSLNPLARVVRQHLVVLQHATLVALWIGATLSLLYVYVRARLRSVVLLVLIGFVGVSIVTRSRIESVSAYGRSVLPQHVDWVDRAKPSGDVILVASRYPATQELETAYFNSSIKRVYTICRTNFGPEFGEQELTVDPSGRLRGPLGRVTAPYVVGRTSLGIRGRIVARNRNGHEVLVAPVDGRVSVAPGTRPAQECRLRRR